MKMLWQALEAEIEQRGIEAVVKDIQRIADQLTDSIASIVGEHTEAFTDHDLRPGSCSRVTWIFRIMRELVDANTSMHRAVRIAHDLAASPSDKGGSRFDRT